MLGANIQELVCDLFMEPIAPQRVDAKAQTGSKVKLRPTDGTHKHITVF
jgi:hypothetical protein